MRTAPEPPPISGEEIQRRIAVGILGMLVVSRRTTRGLSKSQVVVDCRDKPHDGSLGRFHIYLHEWLVFDGKWLIAMCGKCG